MSSDSSIHISSVGFVPVATVTGTLTEKPSQAVGVIVPVVVVVVIVPLATSVAIAGIPVLAVTCPLTGCVPLI